MRMSGRMKSRMIRSGLLAGFCIVLAMGSVVSAASKTDSTASAPEPTLLDFWFALQDSGPVYAPYAYILHRDARSAQIARKKTLIEELGNLIWRLEAAGNSTLSAALEQWRRRIREANDYRTPGQWGPAALLSSPRNGVPVSAVAAVGACKVPSWVEVWSAQGVKRIIWQPDMRLSTLLSEGGILRHTQAKQVSVITPYGQIVQRGIAAWNYEGMPLSPGMRVVAPLPLGSQASEWIQKKLSQFLAHLLPGDTCRQITLKHESANASG